MILRATLSSRIGKSCPVSSHGVFALDDPKGDDVGVCPFIAHDAYRLYRYQYGKGLPDMVELPVSFNFIADDAVSFLQYVESFSVHITDDPYGKARTRERLSVTQDCRATQVLFPTILTSSLKSSRKGSISFSFILFGSPPTL